MRQIFCTLFSLVILANGPSAQVSDKQLAKQIDKLVTGNFSSMAPGCAILVASKDQVILEKAYGIADLELDVPLKPGMVFRIGSVTKQYTAIAILKLMEQGKLALGDSLQKFIPVFPYKGHTITIENLLTHTSGLIDYQVFDIHIENAIRLDLPSSLILDSVGSRPLSFIPGTKYAYSNSNYYILGLIIEKLSGKKYDVYLQEEILKPAGLLNTYYDSPYNIIPGRVSGYNKKKEGIKNAEFLSMVQVFSAGAILSNVSDLFKWNKLLRNYSIVKKETFDKAWGNFRLRDSTLAGYGYGWFNSEFQGMKTIWHAGAIDGFRAMEAYFPEQEIFLAILINSEDSESFFPFVENICKLIAGSSGSVKEIKVPEAILQSYEGTYKWADYPTESISIYKKGNKLYADLSNKSGMNMVFVPQTQSSFYLPDIKRIRTTIEFVLDNGIVKELIWTQEKKQRAIKVN